MEKGIALDELALSHIINAEGEKIQYAVGTIPGLNPGATIQLHIYVPLVGVATLLGGGIGASLMLIRLS